MDANGQVSTLGTRGSDPWSTLGGDVEPAAEHPVSHPRAEEAGVSSSTRSRVSGPTAESCPSLPMRSSQGH